jgi:hypothetical protein
MSMPQTAARPALGIALSNAGRLTAALNRRPLADPEWTHRLMANGSIVSELDTCGQCGHGRAAHSEYLREGDDEPWSFCMGCGGDCEFTASALRFEGEGEG